MAAKAFILIETEVGKTRDAYSALGKLEAIKSIDVVTGPYDIIATVEGDDMGAIGNFVTSNMHNIHSIRRTVTCLSIRVS